MGEGSGGGVWFDDEDKHVGGLQMLMKQFFLPSVL